MFSEWKLRVFSLFHSGSILLFPTAVFRTLMLMILVRGFLDGAFSFSRAWTQRGARTPGRYQLYYPERIVHVFVLLLVRHCSNSTQTLCSKKRRDNHMVLHYYDVLELIVVIRSEHRGLREIASSPCGSLSLQRKHPKTRIGRILKVMPSCGEMASDSIGVGMSGSFDATADVNRFDRTSTPKSDSEKDHFSKGHEIHSQELQSHVATQAFEFVWSKTKLQAQRSHVTAASTSRRLPSPCCLISEPRGH